MDVRGVGTLRHVPGFEPLVAQFVLGTLPADIHEMVRELIEAADGHAEDRSCADKEACRHYVQLVSPGDYLAAGRWKVTGPAGNIDLMPLVRDVWEVLGMTHAELIAYVALRDSHQSHDRSVRVLRAAKTP